MVTPIQVDREVSAIPVKSSLVWLFVFCDKPKLNQFRYFDEIRKILESASQDLMFVDPYLDAEFTSRYLGNVAPGVSMRLLAGKKKLVTLLPAVDAFMKQNQAIIEVRSASNFHDRYIIVDRKSCFQSGASFKDTAKTASTTLTQITDAFAAVLQTYKNLWSTAKIECYWKLP